MAEAAFIGPIITAAGAVANDWFETYTKAEELKKDTGNVKSKKCCCGLFGAITRCVRRRKREEGNDGDGDQSVKPYASSSMRGGDDEDGIHYNGDTSVMPIFVCCGARYINKQFEQGATISDAHESVNKSRRTQNNRQSSHVRGGKRKLQGYERSESCRAHIRVRSIRKRPEYRVTTDV